MIYEVSTAVTRSMFVSRRLAPTTPVLGPQLNCATVSPAVSVAVSHTRMAPSLAPLMSRRLSRAHTRLTTSAAWPRNSLSCVPSARSHTRTRLSSPAPAASLPSGEKETVAIPALLAGKSLTHWASV